MRTMRTSARSAPLGSDAIRFALFGDVQGHVAGCRVDSQVPGPRAVAKGHGETVALEVAGIERCEGSSRKSHVNGTFGL